MSIDRKFATWPLRTEDQREYELEVRYKQGSESASSDITFYVKHPDLAEVLEDSDLNRLRQRAVDGLTELNKVDWKPYLLVGATEGGMPTPPDKRGMHNFPVWTSNGIEFGAFEFLAGKDSKGNQFWKVETNWRGKKSWRIYTDHPLDPTEITLGMSQEIAENRTGWMVVPDTAVNREAISALNRSVRSLLTFLCHFINSPNSADRTDRASFVARQITDIVEEFQKGARANSTRRR